MSYGVSDRVGALLSVVTSATSSYEDAAASLQVLFEGSLSSAATTLQRLLEDGLLFSTVHKLQAVYLLYYVSESAPAAVASLQALAANEAESPAVKSLASSLLAQGSSLPPRLKSVTPLEYLHAFHRKSGDQEAAAGFDSRITGSGGGIHDGFEALLETEAAAEETLDSLGIAELPPDEDLSGWESIILAAARSPLLPRMQAAGMAVLQQQRPTEAMPNSVQPSQIVAAAQHNPEVAAEALCSVQSSGLFVCRNWAAACFWALAEAPTTLNLISCWAALIDRIAVEPAALAAFTSNSIQFITSMQDRIARNRLARMFCHFLDRVLDMNVHAILLFFTQQGLPELFSRLKMLQST